MALKKRQSGARKAEGRIALAAFVTGGMRYPDGLTKAIAQDIVKMIKMGSSVRMACVACGVGMSKFEKWYSRGQLMSAKINDDGNDVRNMEEEDQVCYHFYNMVMTALGTAGAHCAYRLKKNKDWRAQAWRLENIYQDLLGTPSVKALGKDGKPLPEGGAVVTIYIPDNGRSTR